MKGVTHCPHCSKRVLSLSKDGARLRFPTTCLVLHKSGMVEVNCPHCKHGVIVPLEAVSGQKSLKKGEIRHRYVLR